MGGYGAAAVNGFVTAGSLASAAGSGIAQWFMKNKETADVIVEESRALHPAEHVHAHG